MSARFHVIVVGRSRCGWANEAVADYARRLRRFGGVTESAVRAEPFRGDVDTVRRAESARILQRLGSRDRLVVLDERGEVVDGAGFVDLVRIGRQSGRLAFALGGAYGHDTALRDRAWRTVRLSTLVLNHEVARVVLYEQLYRAMATLEGIPYAH